MIGSDIEISVEKTRRCKKCGKTKGIEDFQKYWDKKGGQYYHFHTCRECKNKYFKKYLKAYRKKKKA